MAASELPKGHVETDWANWSPPVEGDVRSPCPAINALANHNILPHDGKGITKPMAVEALTKALHLDSHIANIFASGAVAANPDHRAHAFNLDHVDKHGYIEHYVSLSRDDVALGSNSAFSKARFDEFLENLDVSRSTTTPGAGDSSQKGSGATTEWKSASQARYGRVIESKARHDEQGKQWTYGLKEAILSYGESALYLNLLGKDGAAPLEWVQVFFEEERLPYAEGWRPPPKLDQSMMNHAYLELIEANENKSEEAKLVGLGTFEALKAGLLSLIKDQGCRHW